MRKLLVILIVLAGLAGGAYYYYANWYMPAQAAPAPVLQTAKVRTGDILITAAGTGTVVPEAEVDLAFRSGGLLAAVEVAVGDQVEKGQVLARLEDSAVKLQYAQAELNWKELFSAAAVQSADEAVAAAESGLDKANDALLYLISSNVYTWEQKLAEAQAGLAAAQAALTAGSGDQAAVDAANAAVHWAEINLQQAVDDYAATNPYPPSEETVELARAAVRTAELKLKEAQVYQALLLGQEVSAEDLASASGPGYFKLEQARLNMESARLAVENMQLQAPLDGTVTQVNATAGQTIGAAPLLSLATLDRLLVRFYVEEADLGKLNAGDRVNFTFEAYPERKLGGKVLRLEPTLASVDGASAAVAWASIEPVEGLTLIPGMAVDVEVVANESIGTLLVPAQALRELAPGSYAVFVVQPDGQLKLTPVTVGLKDFANAEILSGLQAGDVVSTGNVETK